MKLRALLPPERSLVGGETLEITSEERIALKAEDAGWRLKTWCPAGIAWTESATRAAPLGQELSRLDSSVFQFEKASKFSTFSDVTGGINFNKWL